MNYKIATDKRLKNKNLTISLLNKAGMLVLLLFLFSGFHKMNLENLPEGNKGIAMQYPEDKNIVNHPAVIFADDFNNYSVVADLKEKWDVLINEEHLSFEVSKSELKGKSLKMTVSKRNDPLATGVSVLLQKKLDVLFLRWYMKFDEDWLIPNGSVHNGASISAKYFDNGKATPGLRADGQNKFLVNFENENSVGTSPGNMNAYVYWPEQGERWGDHFFPTGKVLPYSSERSGRKTFGEAFIARDDFSPETGRWYCYEYMVKVNTPGKRDGRIAMWIDGKLIADFPNLRLRDVEDLKIDRFGLGLYIANNSTRTNHKWHDNVVAATSYIGPKIK